MKKVLAMILALVMVLSLAACGEKAPADDGAADAGANTLYVLGPTPDHGWTAQAGAYAQADPNVYEADYTDVDDNK